MSRPIGLRGLPAPPLITLASRCALGGAISRTGAGAAASGVSPWSDAANCLLAFPFVIEQQTGFYKGFWVNGSAAGGNSQVAIYDEAFALLTSNTSTAGSGASVPQSVVWASGSVPLLLPPGLYYAAMAHDATTTNQVFRWSVGTAGNFWQAMGCWRQSGITLSALPSTATPGDMTNVGFPVFGLVTRTVFDA